MIKAPVFFLLWGLTFTLKAQSPDNIVKTEDVIRIESILSADSMKGRKAFTPSANMAARFISDEFKKIGLSSLEGVQGYEQAFTMMSPTLINVSGSIDGTQTDPKNIIPFTSSTKLEVNEKSGFTKKFIKAGDPLRKLVVEYLNQDENFLVFVDPSFAKNFARLHQLRQFLFSSKKSVVFVLSAAPAAVYDIKITQSITEQKGSNIVGVLPGKGKKDEIVIFSAHYDHIGTEPGATADSIYNGANDDASGVTAIIEMARYFKLANNNDRTLVFAAFTAEETGGFGSRYFSTKLSPDKVVAMVNIEMIGTESKWGRNSAFITGFDKSDLGQILQKNVEGTDFKLYQDPYIQEDLFYRSDNATLARLGVPAHTISTSKMDNEPNYHKVTDEIKTLDMDNMTRIIKSLIISTGSLVNGKDRPTRIKPEQY